MSAFDGPAAAGAATASAGPPFDLNEALEEIPGGEEMAAELAALFFTEYEKIHGRMRSGLASGDLDAVRAGGHTLKGSAAIFAAHALTAAAARAEDRGKAGDAAGAAAALADLEREAARVTDHMRTLWPPADPPR